MLEVLMIRLYAGPRGVFEPGSVQTLDREFAENLIERGDASLNQVDEEEDETEEDDEEEEEE